MQRLLICGSNFLCLILQIIMVKYIITDPLSCICVLLSQLICMCLLVHQHLHYLGVC